MAFQGMKFCKDCNNMLYPREQVDEMAGGKGFLIFYCRSCQYSERANPDSEMENCVYRNEINLSGTATMIIDKESCLDPTLPRAKKVVCTKCGHDQAVFMQSPGNNYDVGMNLIFICANYDKGKACGHYWYQKTKKERQALGEI